MHGKDLIMATLFGGGSSSSGSGGGGEEINELDAFIEDNLAEINSDAKTIAQYALYERTKTKKASFPKAESIGRKAFESCQITELYIPRVNNLSAYALASCYTLVEFRAPSVTSIGESALANMNALVRAYMPSLTGTAKSTFYGSKSLVIADMGQVSTISGNCFWNTYPLRAIILRSETLCTLASTNAIANCYHILGTVDATYNPDGLADGYIYVPSALVDTYKAATNWSTYADQFRALEDYTVDGTITGELDESKI